MDGFIKMFIDGNEFDNIAEVKGRDPLPSLTMASTNSKGDFGRRSTSATLENRELTVTILDGSRVTRLHDTYRELADKIYSAHKSLKVTFSDDPSIYWDCVLTNIEVMEEVNEFSLMEITLDTLPLSTTIKTDHFEVLNNNILNFKADGNYFTYGNLAFTITGAPTALDVRCTNNNSVICLKAKTGNLNGNFEIDMANRVLRKDGALAMQFIDQYRTLFIDANKDKFAVYPRNNTFTIGAIPNNITKAKITYNNRWI